MKIYTIRISDHLPYSMPLWYKNKPGAEFTARLAIVENARGSSVPAFKLNVSPFFHVYPEHCTVVGEKCIQ